MFFARVFISLDTRDTGFFSIILGVTSLLAAANAAAKEDFTRRVDLILIKRPTLYLNIAVLFLFQGSMFTTQVKILKKSFYSNLHFAALEVFKGDFRPQPTERGGNYVRTLANDKESIYLSIKVTNILPLALGHNG